MYLCALGLCQSLKATSRSQSTILLLYSSPDWSIVATPSNCHLVLLATIECKGQAPPLRKSCFGIENVCASSSLSHSSVEKEIYLCGCTRGLQHEGHRYVLYQLLHLRHWWFLPSKSYPYDHLLDYKLKMTLQTKTSKIIVLFIHTHERFVLLTY